MLRRILGGHSYGGALFVCDENGKKGGGADAEKAETTLPHVGLSESHRPKKRLL